MKTDTEKKIMEKKHAMKILFLMQNMAEENQPDRNKINTEKILVLKWHHFISNKRQIWR